MNIKIKNKFKNKFNIKLINNKTIKLFNNKYKKNNNPTDILSFKTNYDIHFLGDIFINTYYLNNKSTIKMKTHGALHLLNYNHVHNYDAKIMLKIERIIGMSGIEPPTTTTSK